MLTSIGAWALIEALHFRISCVFISGHIIPNVAPGTESAVYLKLQSWSFNGL